jgi:hypothetical protein
MVASRCGPLVCHVRNIADVRAMMQIYMSPLHDLVCFFAALDFILCDHLAAKRQQMSSEQVSNRAALDPASLTQVRNSVPAFHACQHQVVQVGEACKRHNGDIKQLVFELYPIAQLYALEAVPAYMQHYLNKPIAIQEVLDGVFEYSDAVASAVPSLKMASREFEWRNGFFLWRQPTPQHVELLQAAGFGQRVDAIAAAEGYRV